MDQWDRCIKPFLDDKPLSNSLYNYYLAEEGRCIRMLVRDATPTEEERDAVKSVASQLVNAARKQGAQGVSVDSFMKEFSLDTEEGISLMCLAEALIRVPDADTAQMFIQDKLKDEHWQDRVGQSRSFWVNASTWGLLFTGKMFNVTPEEGGGALRQMMHRLGAPLVLKAVQQAVSLIGDQFVCEQTIDSAFKAAKQSKRYLYSFDMLGEAAMVPEDAERYFSAYKEAIEYVGQENSAADHELGIEKRPGVSIKLSALNCRYEPRKRSDQTLLRDRLMQLVMLARELNVPVTIDAEESYRLELMLELFGSIFSENMLQDWPHFGLAVQAYQKRANATMLWLKSLALKNQRSIPVRLVKGAYWDHEIKKAQQQGLSNYPVFTRKDHTDISYLTCAQFILKHPDLFYGQFGTHNAHTIASIHFYSQSAQNSHFEFQRLHGMGQAIYGEYLSLFPEADCRVYSPVGRHKELLPYLVRRLLENGANSSFVRALNDKKAGLDDLVEEPTVLAMEGGAEESLTIPLPRDIYLPRRLNSSGMNLHSNQALADLYTEMEPYLELQYGGKDQDQPIRNPADRNHILGSRNLKSSEDCQMALERADNYYSTWSTTSPIHRAERLERLAELIEENKVHLMALLITEVGKTLWNAHNEVREAVDFCRYYAAEVRDKFVAPKVLPGPTGEDNGLFLEGRGVFLCISPWNYPLAIFLGQVCAALGAGNCVVAKPATDVELVAGKIAELIYTAGFPEDAFHMLNCPARIFATNLLSDARVSGVAFTGSLEAARSINIQLAQRKSGIATTIMETGGQNAMIVDSTALPEQVVQDIIKSAFDSAGQRCSALRVLFLQEEIAPRIIELLVGRMATLKVGNPLDPEVDVGPVISENAKTALLMHLEYICSEGDILATSPIDDDALEQGYFVAPTLVEIESMSLLEKEVFGPILHVIRFTGDAWEDVISQINSARYGLTLGIHSRIESRAYELARRVHAGNVYINREMIGSTVGSQPFGGLGQSGTGPKAGGPNYVTRFAAEKTISNNVTAMGGNLRLLSGGR